MHSNPILHRETCLRYSSKVFVDRQNLAVFVLVETEFQIKPDIIPDFEDIL